MQHVILVKAEKERAPLPTAWGVLYAPPNKDGSRKSCSNCMMWVKTDQCLIHKKSLKVVKDAVCGYHVYGKPMDKWMDHPGMQPVDSKTSGLEVIKGGTSCDTCRYYKAHGNKSGVCVAVHTNGKPTPVMGLGCCARWEAQGD